MKLTKKQYYGYQKAHKEFISQNDAYNKPRFGITLAEYNTIHHAVISANGIMGGFPPYKKVAKECIAANGEAK